ncbi:hypothetical protein NQ314_016789 [Rhamnusium bicolor]|uniref:Transposase n=1 Tax=Rhamnusium bicolor TaxID=1586634 RepID=A0AAV8WUI1_9CUCU|nr:hypothetical protein NQ314_016789 [Rhamnusium bicolor]
MMMKSKYNLANTEQNIGITIESDSIEQVKEFKYLGITIDEYLNFSNHTKREFVLSFLKHHKDQLRTRICQNIKRSRATVSYDKINAYFDNLATELKNVPPSNIIHFDETNLSDDPCRKMVIFKRGCRYPECLCNSSKSAVSLMFAASADSKLLPPYIVYRAQNLYTSWKISGPKGARYNRSSSGWFDAPLDVAFFRPLKTGWRQILEKWKMGAGSKCASIPKHKFPHLLNEVLKVIEPNADKNIKSGFNKCGIFPLNRDKVLQRLPQNEAHEHNDENVEEGLNNFVVHFLKSMSVKDADFESSSDEQSEEENEMQDVHEFIESEPSNTGQETNEEMDLPLNILGKKPKC